MYCARELRAPESMASLGMESLIQSVVDRTVENGPMDAKKLIPSPKTITRHIKIGAGRESADVEDLIVPLERDGYHSATTDGWTESHV